MGYTLEQLSNRIDSIRNQCFNDYVKLVDIIDNISDMIRQEFDKKYFNMKFTNYVHGKLIELLNHYKFKTNGLLGAYIDSINYKINIYDDLTYSISYDEGKFDRSHMIETDYTTSKGIHVVHKISSGDIIDMVDSGRDNFEIHATHGRVVRRFGKKYRWIVYRANNEKRTEYIKDRNYKKYDPTEKDQYRFLVPDGTSLTVNGSRHSTFGIHLYRRIKKYANDNDSISNQILGSSIDDFMVSFLLREVTPLMTSLKKNIMELIKFIKMYNVERNY